MTAQALAATEAATAGAVTARPYAPSWLDRAVQAIDALPGPTWLAYIVFGAIALFWANSIGWIAGMYPVGTLDAQQSSFAFFLVYPFVLLHILDRAAGKALRRFAPAMDRAPADVSRIEYELTTIPARRALVLGLVGAGVDLLSWIGDPVASDVVGYPLPALIVRAAGEYLLVATWFVLVYQVFRQLRLVSRLHAQASRIDLFHAAPLHAFSHLTVRAGIGVLGAAVYTVFTTKPDLLFTSVALTFLGAIVVVGLAAFVVPLMGMHARIAQEKDRLLDEANEGLETTLRRLNESVAADDLSRSDALNKMLSSLLQQRDVLSKFPTWPWQAGTAWAFVSAIGLPIGLWLLTRLLERVI